MFFFWQIVLVCDKIDERIFVYIIHSSLKRTKYHYSNLVVHGISRKLRVASAVGAKRRGAHGARRNRTLDKSCLEFSTAGSYIQYINAPTLETCYTL